MKLIKQKVRKYFDRLASFICNLYLCHAINIVDYKITHCSYRRSQTILRLCGLWAALHLLLWAIPTSQTRMWERGSVPVHAVSLPLQTQEQPQSSLRETPEERDHLLASIIMDICVFFKISIYLF